MIGSLLRRVVRLAELDDAQAPGAAHPARQRLAKALFLRLVKVGDGTADLCCPGRPDVLEADLPGGDGAAEVIDRFTLARLLTQQRDAITIAHEALLSSWPRLSRWLSDGRDDHLMRQRLEDAAAAWDRDGGDVSALCRGTRLKAALAWARDHQADLGTLARGYLLASSRRHRRARAAWLTAVAGAMTLALAAGTTSAIAISEHLAGERNAEHVAYNQAIREASQEMPGNPQLAIQLELAAYRIHPSPAAAARLIAAENTPLYSPLPVTADTAAFSPDSNVFATGGHSAQLWKAAGAGRARRLGRPFARMHRFTLAPSLSGPVTSLAFSPDDRILVVSDGAGAVQLWDVASPAHAHPLGSVAADAFDGAAVAFSPDGGTLAIGDNEGNVHLWRVSNPSRPRPAGHCTSPATHLADIVAGVQPARPCAGHRGRRRHHPAVELSQPGSPGGARAAATQRGRSYVSLAFSGAGTVLAIAGSKDSVQLWNTTDPARPRLTGKLPAAGSGPGMPPPLALAGARVVTTSADGNIRIWDVNVSNAMKGICAVPGDQLTPAQWHRYIPQLPYAATCPQ